jgi:tetratricopeptide (TPR) repeat protein
MSMVKRLIGHVCIVSADAGRMRADRIALANLGAQRFALFDSAAKANEFLTRNEVDLVVCDVELADGDGVDFAARLKDGPCRATPVIMAASNAGRKTVVRAFAVGCAGFLVRPYTLEALERQIVVAWRSVKDLDYDPALAAEAAQARIQRAADLDDASDSTPVSDIPKTPGNAKRYFEQGVKRFEQGDPDEALAAFAVALDLNPAFIDPAAWAGRAYVAKDRPDKAEEFFRWAAGAYAAQDRFHETQQVVSWHVDAGLPPFNPFLQRARELWLTDECERAIMALRRAVRLAPDDEQPVLGLALAYRSLGRDDSAMSVLERALEEDSGFERARSLLAELQGPQEEEPAEVTIELPEPPPSTLASILRRISGRFQRAA